MLTGYQKTEAVALILSRVYSEDYSTLSSDMLEPLISQCVDADFNYMISSKVCLPNGTDGDYFYNKNNARVFIIITLLRNNRFTEAHCADLFNLVEDYMDFNRSYLELNGLSYHEDERLFEYRSEW